MLPRGWRPCFVVRAAAHFGTGDLDSAVAQV
jgi:hypothetical protein